MKLRLCLIALAAAGFAVSAFFAIGGPLKYEAPPETARFKTAPGAELVSQNCLLCHSADYVIIQPRMPRAFWEAGVKKMREKYGAPLPPENVSEVVDYLVKNYGKE